MNMSNLKTSRIPKACIKNKIKNMTINPSYYLFIHHTTVHKSKKKQVRVIMNLYI